MALKRSGYRVACNDAGMLSWVYADAFLLNSGLPELDPTHLIPSRLKADAGRRAHGVLQTTTPRDLNDEDRRTAILQVLGYLESMTASDLPRTQRNTFIFDCYCEQGRWSKYTSLRGRSGRRRFFSPPNALRIDLILNQLRSWLLDGAITRPAHSFLTAILMDAVEKVSNTQGTYHDFPREFYDPRALRPLKLQLSGHDWSGPVDHIVGQAEDSLEFIRRVPAHQVLYVDPPYNFRQYTAYYFLPNMLARYAYIVDLQDYFANISFVRGQNMQDDFISTFCKATEFISSLATLVERARTKVVVLSYFNGSNHWTAMGTAYHSRGEDELRRFFNGDLFVHGSLQVIPIERINYQSYGGHRARLVEELLFVATKQTPSQLRKDSRAVAFASASNEGASSDRRPA